MIERVRRLRDDEQGETLLELLVAIAILGVCVVAIAAGIALSIRISAIHREQTTAGAFVRSYAEAIESTVQNSPTWSGCAASAATYANPTGFATTNGSNTGYNASVTKLEFWDGSQFLPTCASDTGVQRLTLTVSTGDGQVAEQLVIVIRDPCATSC